ncbi:MAG: Gfo/Idh/MocA family oxidoreductase [Truepera sp.]|nr:Gfo/Idh/MocA family oxidoreductase [Truepera sp.]
MLAKIRWGILGTGTIARQFAAGLRHVEGAELIAVGSRSSQTAEAFAATFGVPRRYASYDELVTDPDLDVVYIATPHPFHQDNSLQCLQAGKAVLCEKPFTVNAQEATTVINLARERGLFVMEAMWTRFLPLFVKLRELIAQGVLGELRLLQVDFGFRAGFNPQGRLFNPQLAGGALLDVGVYNLSLASLLWGRPERVHSAAYLGETGVDEQSAVILSYTKGRLATLTSAIRTATPQEALLIGTDGWLKIHAPWWKATAMTLAVAGQAPQLIEVPFAGNGYNYQADEVGRCLRAGRLESAVMPLDETLAIMATLDEIRHQWGLRYPVE